jgi:hypothetical protein
MHVPITPGTPLAPVAEASHALALPFHPDELVAALDCADQAQAPPAARAYAGDWRRFAAWCALRDLTPLPAAPETVAVFIAHQARAGVKPSTPGRRVAAIRPGHAAVQLEPSSMPSKPTSLSSARESGPHDTSCASNADRATC